MKVEYGITENDYMKAMQLHASRQSKSGKPAFIAARAIVAILVLGGWWTAPDAVRTFAVVVVVMMLAFGPALQVHILVPRGTRRMYRKYKAIQEPFVYELSEDGLMVTSVAGEVTLQWRMILKWRQNDQFVLIYTMPLLFHVVPKSLAQQGFDIPLLVQHLAERVGPEG